MKHVGRTETGHVCGFSDYEGGPHCGAPPTMHGLFLDTWEGQSTGLACKEHAAALLFVADEFHEIYGDHHCSWSDRVERSSA